MGTVQSADDTSLEKLEHDPFIHHANGARDQGRDEPRAPSPRTDSQPSSEHVCAFTHEAVASDPRAESNSVDGGDKPATLNENGGVEALLRRISEETDDDEEDCGDDDDDDYNDNDDEDWDDGERLWGIPIDAVSCASSGVYFGAKKHCSGADCIGDVGNLRKNEACEINEDDCDYFNGGETASEACERELAEMCGDEDDEDECNEDEEECDEEEEEECDEEEDEDEEECDDEERGYECEEEKEEEEEEEDCGCDDYEEDDDECCDEDEEEDSCDNDDEEEVECNDEDYEDECDDSENDEECEEDEEDNVKCPNDDEKDKKPDIPCGRNVPKDKDKGKSDNKNKSCPSNKKCHVIISPCDNYEDNDEEEEDDGDKHVDKGTKVNSKASIRAYRMGTKYCRGEDDYDDDDDDDDDDEGEEDDDDVDDDEIIITDKDYREIIVVDPDRDDDNDDGDNISDEERRYQEAAILIGKRAMAAIDHKYKAYGGGRYSLFEDDNEENESYFTYKADRSTGGSSSIHGDLSTNQDNRKRRHISSLRLIDIEDEDNAQYFYGDYDELGQRNGFIPEDNGDSGDDRYEKGVIISRHHNGVTGNDLGDLAKRDGKESPGVKAGMDWELHSGLYWSRGQPRDAEYQEECGDYCPEVSEFKEKPLYHQININKQGLHEESNQQKLSICDDKNDDYIHYNDDDDPSDADSSREKKEEMKEDSPGGYYDMKYNKKGSMPEQSKHDFIYTKKNERFGVREGSSMSQSVSKKDYFSVEREHNEIEAYFGDSTKRHAMTQPLESYDERHHQKFQRQRRNDSINSKDYWNTPTSGWSVQSSGEETDQRVRSEKRSEGETYVLPSFDTKMAVKHDANQRTNEHNGYFYTPSDGITWVSKGMTSNGHSSEPIEKQDSIQSLKDAAQHDCYSYASHLYHPEILQPREYHRPANQNVKPKPNVLQDSDRIVDDRMVDEKTKSLRTKLDRKSIKSLKKKEVEIQNVKTYEKSKTLPKPSINGASPSKPTGKLLDKKPNLFSVEKKKRSSSQDVGLPDQLKKTPAERILKYPSIIPLPRKAKNSNKSKLVLKTTPHLKKPVTEDNEENEMKKSLTRRKLNENTAPIYKVKTVQVGEEKSISISRVDKDTTSPKPDIEQTNQEQNRIADKTKTKTIFKRSLRGRPSKAETYSNDTDLSPVGVESDDQNKKRPDLTPQKKRSSLKIVFDSKPNRPKSPKAKERQGPTIRQGVNPTGAATFIVKSGMGHEDHEDKVPNSSQTSYNQSREMSTLSTIKRILESKNVSPHSAEQELVDDNDEIPIKDPDQPTREHAADDNRKKSKDYFKQLCLEVLKKKLRVRNKHKSDNPDSHPYNLKGISTNIDNRSAINEHPFNCKPETKEKDLMLGSGDQPNVSSRTKFMPAATEIKLSQTKQRHRFKSTLSSKDDKKKSDKMTINLSAKSKPSKRDEIDVIADPICGKAKTLNAFTKKSKTKTFSCYEEPNNIRLSEALESEQLKNPTIDEQKREKIVFPLDKYSNDTVQEPALDREILSLCPRKYNTEGETKLLEEDANSKAKASIDSILRRSTRAAQKSGMDSKHNVYQQNISNGVTTKRNAHEAGTDSLIRKFDSRSKKRPILRQNDTKSKFKASLSSNVNSLTQPTHTNSAEKSQKLSMEKATNDIEPLIYEDQTSTITTIPKQKQVVDQNHCVTHLTTRSSLRNGKGLNNICPRKPGITAAKKGPIGEENNYETSLLIVMPEESELHRPGLGFTHGPEGLSDKHITKRQNYFTRKTSETPQKDKLASNEKEIRMSQRSKNVHSDQLTHPSNKDDCVQPNTEVSKRDNRIGASRVGGRLSIAFGSSYREPSKRKPNSWLLSLHNGAPRESSYSGKWNATTRSGKILSSRNTLATEKDSPTEDISNKRVRTTNDTPANTTKHEPEGNNEYCCKGTKFVLETGVSLGKVADEDNETSWRCEKYTNNNKIAADGELSMHDTDITIQTITPLADEKIGCSKAADVSGTGEMNSSKVEVSQREALATKCDVLENTLSNRKRYRLSRSIHKGDGVANSLFSNDEDHK